MPLVRQASPELDQYLYHGAHVSLTPELSCGVWLLSRAAEAAWMYCQVHAAVSSNNRPGFSVQ